MHRSAVVVATLCLAAAACSGDDDEPVAVDTTIEDVATSVPASTAPPTTDPPVITEPPTTTASTTSTSTTTTSLPFVLDPGPERDALDAFYAAREYRVECLRALPNCDTGRWSEFAVGPPLERTVQLYEDLNTRGVAVQGVETIRDFIEQVAIVSTEPTTVQILYCSEDGSGAAPPTNAALVSTVSVAEVQIQPDGVWRLTGNAEQERAVGSENSLCSS